MGFISYTHQVTNLIIKFTYEVKTSIYVLCPLTLINSVKIDIIYASIFIRLNKLPSITQWVRRRGRIQIHICVNSNLSDFTDNTSPS